MPTTYLVLDIETIPDPSMWRPEPQAAKREPKRIRLKDSQPPTKNDLAFLSAVMKAMEGVEPIHPKDLEKAQDIATRGENEKALAAIEEKIAPEISSDSMPPLYACRPIVLACVWLSDDLKPKRVGTLKIDPSGNLDEEERKMLSEWTEFMSTTKPTIVTWFGRGFDLPVIQARSFKYGIQNTWYYDDRDYRYRFSEERHVDLCDVLSDYGATKNMKLGGYARMCGMPGKHGVDGSMVAGMFSQGKYEQITNYCLTDALQTAFVFQRWRLTKGRTTPENYRAAAGALLEATTATEELREFRDLIDDKMLLLQGEGTEKT